MDLGKIYKQAREERLFCFYIFDFSAKTEIDMTDKARKILDKLNKKNRKPPMSIRERVLQQFNASTLDDVGPVKGGDQELKVLKEIDELQQFENDIWNPKSV